MISTTYAQNPSVLDDRNRTFIAENNKSIPIQLRRDRLGLTLNGHLTQWRYTRLSTRPIISQIEFVECKNDDIPSLDSRDGQGKKEDKVRSCDNGWQ
jgi:hypothetical protein